MKKKIIVIFFVVICSLLIAQEPLFDVKNDAGISIFTVYPDGIKIMGMKLDATESDLSIKNDAGTELLRLDQGGMNLYDADGQRLLAADADSIRFYLYEDPQVDEGRGGFAIATVGSTTDENGDKFFNLTPENYFIGHESGKANTTGIYNSFMGYQTGITNEEGDRNLFFGYQSGHNNLNGRLNSFFGYKAGFGNIGGVDNEGNYNSFYGNEAGLANQTGYHNTFVGHYSGHSNVSGYANTFVGSSTGYYSTGIRNTFIGSGSSVMGTSGSYNTFVGSWSGQMSNGGSNNIFIGYASGQNTHSGNNNTCIGTRSGRTIYGSGNVMIGFRSGFSDTSSNKLYIANGSTADSTLIYGKFDDQFIGIADNDPSARLSLGGTGSTNGISLGDDQTTPVRLFHTTVGLQISGPNSRIHYGSYEYMEDGGSYETSFNSDLRPDQNNYYDLGTSEFRWDDVYATNGTIVTSDIRDKENIVPVQYGLAEIMQLNPVSFNWKGKNTEDKKLGLIAQELMEVVPEVVKTHDEKIIDEETGEKQIVELDRYGVYYSDLIPVLIKSIQEQQQTIEELTKKIEALEEIIK